MSTDAAKSKPARISNPRRILVLAPSAEAQVTIPSFLHGLTGVHVAESHRGVHQDADDEVDLDEAARGGR